MAYLTQLPPAMVLYSHAFAENSMDMIKKQAIETPN